MSVSHGHSTIGGIEYDGDYLEKTYTIDGISYGGCGEDKKKEIVSHQLDVSTGYRDAHQ